MKKSLVLLMGLVLLSSATGVRAQLVAPTIPDDQKPIYPIGPPVTLPDNSIVQFSNLTVQKVSSNTAPGTIYAYPLAIPAGTGTGGSSGGGTITPSTGAQSAPASSAGPTITCVNFKDLSAERGVSIGCPVPKTNAPVLQSATSVAPPATGKPEFAPAYVYRIEVTSDTRLMLRNRASATLGNFTAGDQINVFGYYQNDGSVKALIIRNLSKPEEKRFFQLDNVELVSISSNTDPANLVVIQRQSYPCYDFGASGERKTAAPCPAGIKSFEQNAETMSIKIPETIAPYVPAARKYVVKVDGQTILVDRNRNRMNLRAFSVGDQLNIYGVAASGQSEVIEADIVRNLSKPAAEESFRGNVSHINNDGSFVIKTGDGRTLTVMSPLQIGAFVSLRGILDATKNVIDQVSELSVKSQTGGGAVILSISSIYPSSGIVGTKITIKGTGFTPAGNAVNFGGGYIPNISSNGNTITFSVPQDISPACAYPRQGQPVCLLPAMLTTPGKYQVSVTNTNGTSNEIGFLVTATTVGSLEINSYSMPTATLGAPYNGTVQATGGTDSYSWSISQGALPPGLTLTPAVCIAAPCKAPLTISGTPNMGGVYAFTITVRSGSESASKEFTLSALSGLYPGQGNNTSIQ